MVCGKFEKGEGNIEKCNSVIGELPKHLGSD
jgi:hypothetical protein